MVKSSYSDGEFAKFMTTITAEQLGNLIGEYINEAVHNSWDGHPSRDVTAYRHLFSDIMTYHKEVVKDKPKHFDQSGFGGVEYFNKQK